MKEHCSFGLKSLASLSFCSPQSRRSAERIYWTRVLNFQRRETVCLRQELNNSAVTRSYFTLKTERERGREKKEVGGGIHLGRQITESGSGAESKDEEQRAHLFLTDKK